MVKNQTCKDDRTGSGHAPWDREILFEFLLESLHLHAVHQCGEMSDSGPGTSTVPLLCCLQASSSSASANETETIDGEWGGAGSDWEWAQAQEDTIVLCREALPVAAHQPLRPLLPPGVTAARSWPRWLQSLGFPSCSVLHPLGGIKLHLLHGNKSVSAFILCPCPPPHFLLRKSVLNFHVAFLLPPRSCQSRWRWAVAHFLSAFFCVLPLELESSLLFCPSAHAAAFVNITFNLCSEHFTNGENKARWTLP